MSYGKPTPPVSNDLQDWFAYIRVSSDDQREKQTIETQRREVERLGLVPADHIDADDGVSGMVPAAKRPGFRTTLAKMNAHARSGRNPQLLLNYLDRLGRDGRDTVNTALDLLEQGFRLRTIFEGDFENTPEGRLKVMIHSGMAESARFRILQGTGDGQRRKVEGGGYTGGFIAYGYRKEGERDTARLAPDVDHIPGLRLSPVEVVRRIFQMVAKGKACQEVVDWLNATGIPPSKQSLSGAIKTGRPSIWRPNSVRVIVINPIYKGTLQWGRRKVIEKRLTTNPPESVIIKEYPHLAIVKPELWATANVELHKNQILAMSNAKDKYLLRGLIWCGVEGCGCRYTGRGTHYACIGRHCWKRIRGENGQPCPAPTVRRADLERAIEEDIEGFNLKPGAVRLLLQERMAAEGGGNVRLVADDIKELESALENQERKKNQAVTLFIENVIPRAKLNEQLERINAASVVISDRLAELRKVSAEQDAIELALDTAASYLEDVQKETRGKLTFEKRRRAVEALVERITVMPVVEGQKLPQIKVVYTFQPHAQRVIDGWRQSERNASRYVPA